MKTELLQWQKGQGWNKQPSETMQKSAALVLLFAARPLLENPDLLAEVKKFYPNAIHAGCSTGGEIYQTEVKDDTVVVTAVQFDHTEVKGALGKVIDAPDSFQLGKMLVEQLPRTGLAHVLCFSDGLQVNGSELVNGMMSQLPANVAITGGLSGDGTHFGKTLTYLDSDPQPGNVIAIGFYGNRLKVGYGSVGGWDTYGLVRQITRSKGNVLYELDGQPALTLYKKYLGELTKDLPASALLFPLNMRRKKEDNPLVRTILAVNEAEQTMTFAGDVPEGGYVQLMKANFDRLIDGASLAANTSIDNNVMGVNKTAKLAILISCIGRKLILKQRIEEEIEAVRNVLGESTPLTGFYSYGEISPFTPDVKPELHNQTMTITTLTE